MAAVEPSCAVQSDRIIAVTHASMVHPVTSSNAAQAIDRCPSLVCVRPRSDRIRARTGNAVMLIETPMNKANGRPGVDGAAKARISRDKTIPAEKGRMMLRSAVLDAALRRL